MRVSRALAVLLLASFTVLACHAQVATEDIEPESYRVYSALLSAESVRLTAQGSLLIRSLTDRTGDSKIQLEKCFAALDQVPASAIEDFQDTNKRRFRLQDRFDIKSLYKVISDLPNFFLELSAVGFNPEKTVGIVSLSEVNAPPDSTTVQGERVFYLLRKEHGIWMKVADGCRRRFVILSNGSMEPILDIQRK